MVVNLSYRAKRQRDRFVRIWTKKGYVLMGDDGKTLTFAGGLK